MSGKVDFDKPQLVELAVLVDSMSIVMPMFDKYPEELIRMVVEYLYQVWVMLK
jgi:hypothetical protein